MKNLFTISVVIISIVVLSLKDTLNLAHIILHKIPNPFHYHDNPHHHANEMIEEDHHHEDEEHDHHHEFEHAHDDADEDHDHEEYHHQHSLKDHINGIEEDDHQNSKENTKDLGEIDWYINALYSLHYEDFFELIKIKKYFIISCFKTLNHIPFSPPPEY